MRFCCVNDSVPLTTAALLRTACAARSLEFVEIDARAFDYAEHRQLAGGDMLYRPAISIAAIRVEQFLFQERVASFYRPPESIYYQPSTSPLRFQRAGLPIPATVYCSTTQRGIIRGLVEQVGGFPIVVKVLGYSSGIGVMKVDSYPILFSVLDFALAQRHNPLLCAYIDHATHWRLIVLGDVVVAAYVNEPDADDFRTHAPNDERSYTTTVRPDLAGIAVQAVQVIQTEFAGVDLLEDQRGNVFLLEANFPCYFAHPQEVAGIDISGMMVEHLLRKAVGYAASL